MKVIIKPAIELNDVLPFLMGHVKMDLTVIQRATGRSEDDIYLLLHRICHSFTEKHESMYQTKRIRKFVISDFETINTKYYCLLEVYESAQMWNMFIIFSHRFSYYHLRQK